MFDSILVSILRTLSKKELSQFEKFILSPYFTEGKRIRSQAVLDYFYILKKFYPSFTGNKFTKQYLFSKLRGGSKYNDSLFRKINSDLLKLAEKFLIQIELENNETDQKKNLLKQSSGRDLEKLFSRIFNSMLTHINGLERDEEYYFETYWSWKNYWDFYVGKKNYSRMNECINHMDSFFIYSLLNSLRIYLWGISFSGHFGKKYDLMMNEEILSYVGKNIEALSKVPQIIIIYYLIMLLTKNDEQYFTKLKELKHTHFNNLNTTDKLNLLIMMRNYCHVMILAGQTQFRRERFELDKEFFELTKKLNIKMHIFALLSSVKNANRIKEFKWVEKITEEFDSNSSSDEKEFAKHYVMAEICFFKKEYNKSLQHLSTIKTLYSNQKQYVRNLMLQIYFETSSYEEALSLIDTSKHFLKRDGLLNKNVKDNSLSFIKFLEKLVLLNGSSDKQDYLLLKKKIIETDEVFNKDWLTEKIEDIEKA